jgi:hypothetical protein
MKSYVIGPYEDKKSQVDLAAQASRIINLHRKVGFKQS